MGRSGKNGTIPDSWLRVRLGDVAAINRLGWDPSDDSSILYIDLTAVVTPGRLAPPRELLAEDAPSRARRRVQTGDILVSTVRPNLRGFARVGEAPENLVASTGFAVLSPGTLVDGSLLYHHVMTNHFAEYLENATTGQAYPAVRPRDIAEFRLPLPPLPEQRAIAAVLDTIDEAIERTEAVVAATAHLRDALLHELLTRGVPGWHTEWREATGVGTIPADWKVVRLGDVAEAVTSGSRAWSRYFNPDGALFVRSQNISGGTIDRSDAIFVQPPADVEAVRTRIYQRDLLVSITGEPGNIAVADDTLGQAYVSQHVALVRLNDPELSSFAGEFLRGRAGQNQFRGMAYGQTRPGLSLINVKNAKVAIPSPSERNAIANVGKSLHTAIKENRSERDRLQSLKASASDALLMGRVQV